LISRTALIGPHKEFGPGRRPEGSGFPVRVYHFQIKALFSRWLVFGSATYWRYVFVTSSPPTWFQPWC